MLILPKNTRLRESYSFMPKCSALAQRLLVGGLLTVAVLAAYPLAAGRQQPSSPVPAAAAAQVDPKAVIDQYCISCHSERLKQAGLVLEKRDYTKIADEAEVSEKGVKKL